MLERFIQQLLNSSTMVGRAYREHIAFNGELLPHVFMGDVTRVVADLHKRAVLDADVHAEQELVAILAQLELGMQARDPEIRNVVAASFVENLDTTDPLFTSLEGKLGPSLREQLYLIRGS